MSFLKKGAAGSPAPALFFPPTQHGGPPTPPHPLLPLPPLRKLKLMSQEKLFDLDKTRPAGRHEIMLDRALSAAADAQKIDALDSGLVSLAMANAWALDEIEAQGKVNLIGTVTAPYREVLEELSLTPSTRSKEANDEFAQAVAALGD